MGTTEPSIPTGRFDTVNSVCKCDLIYLPYTAAKKNPSKQESSSIANYLVNLIRILAPSTIGSVPDKKEGRGVLTNVPDPSERDCSVYLILLPSLTIPLISLSLSTSAVAVATLHLDAAAAPVSIAISCPWFGCFGLSYFRGGGLPCAYACGGDSKSRAESE